MDRIVVDAGIHFGKPCVAGTRIPVQDVLELVDQELPFNQIIQDYYPELTAADIHACIRYAIALVGAQDIRLRAAPVWNFISIGSPAKAHRRFNDEIHVDALELHRSTER